jgi:o-succinylbenzoate synthase
MPIVVRAEVVREALPLQRPYVLSFATLTTFDALIGRLEWADGTVTWGEVVPLPGYTRETADGLAAEVRELAGRLPGRDAAGVRDALRSALPRHATACSVWLCAAESHTAGAVGAADEYRVPVVWAGSSESRSLAQDALQAVASGFQTLKIKIGKSIADDCEAVGRLASAGLPPGVRLRFDANQAYTADEADRFAALLEECLPDATELLEQPFDPDAWADSAWLARRTAIPLMLDESIWTAEDVRRAADVGARLVKLKVCKHGGAAEVAALAALARERGLDLVLGNGVATDVTNHVELALQARRPDLFGRASEANGFAKLSRRLLHPALRLERGAAVAGGNPKGLDHNTAAGMRTAGPTEIQRGVRV